MAIRGTNIFAQLQDSDDEDHPAPKAAASIAVKPSKAGPVSLPPAPKHEPRVAEDSLADAAKPQARGVEKKAKPVQDDRHSKTGRGKELKKDGQGAHNWGGERQGKGKGPNAGGGRDKPEKQEGLAETVEPEVPELEEAEKETTAAPVPEAKPEAKKSDEPDFIRLRREEEEKARKEAESFRTYKEYLGAEEEAGDKPKAAPLLGFMGAEGSRGRGRGGRRQEEGRKVAAPDLRDQFAFPKLG